MTSYLLFVLAGPMAAWGETALGQRRPTRDHPTKSAVIGLVGAALGLPRGDARLADLAADLGYAVRLDRPGVALCDYHTAQAPHGDPARHRWRTRGGELSADRINTVVTRRDYRSDIAYTVALWSRGGDRGRLATVSAALQRPHWALYLGRKSCPLGVPPGPRVIDAPDLLAALAEPLPAHTLALPGDRPRGDLIYYEPDCPGAPTAWISEQTVFDQPRAEIARGFRPRTERLARIPAAPVTPESFFEEA